MAKPNYSFEKRRRDLDKKAKKEQKRLDKIEAKASGKTSLSDGEEAVEGDETTDADETEEPAEKEN